MLKSQKIRYNAYKTNTKRTYKARLDIKVPITILTVK